MKKIAISLVVIIAFVVYAYFMHSDNDDDAGVVKAPSSANPNTTSTAANYKDGEYTGSVADAYYGNVQVKAVIKGGKIDDVVFLLYPNDRQTSERINQQAMPYLKQEAIQVQSAKVDVVSGATQTSLGFQQSLASALSKAKKN